MQVGLQSILSAVDEILERPLVEPQIGEILVPPQWHTLDGRKASRTGYSITTEVGPVMQT
jgi:hypothetical protein